MPTVVNFEQSAADLEARALAAAQGGDARAFSELSERYRPALRAHCYRMLGSTADAEDMVRETLLRAWRGRSGFQGRSLFRSWLYRIATNACLSALERAPVRVLPQDVSAAVTAETPASEARPQPTLAREVPWLEPYPDHLLEAGGAFPDEPEAVLATRQTIELAFLAALQHLPPQQRAVLLLAEVLGWSSKEVAEQLELSVASVNSSLQRAHASLSAKLPPGRTDWAPSVPISARQRQVLSAFMLAWEQGDVAQLTSLLREDARWSMPPAPLWFDGRAAIVNLLTLYPPGWQGSFKLLETAANRQPAAAAYLRPHGQTAYRLVGVMVLRVEASRVAELTTFGSALCGAFGLVSELPG